MNLSKCVRFSALFAAIFSASAVSANCEFSLAAAMGDGVDASGESFRARVGWEDGAHGYAAGCAIVNWLLDEHICGEFFRDQAGQPCLHPSEFGDPLEEAVLLQMAADFAWSYQEGANMYDPTTWNYTSPVAPPWLLMTNQQWDQFRQGRGDCRGGGVCGISMSPR